MSGGQPALYLECSGGRTDAGEQVGACRPASAITLLTELLTGKASPDPHWASSRYSQSVRFTDLTLRCAPGRESDNLQSSVNRQLPGTNPHCAPFFLSLLSPW